MSGFLYFRAKHTRTVAPQDLKSWGLSYAFEAGVQSCVCQNNTPTKSSGIVFGEVARHGDGRVKMDMEAQEWRKMSRPGQEDVYIGYWKDAPPRPADLARKNQLGGYTVPLADGHKWLCPLVRYFDEGAGELKTNLPSYLEVDDAGELVPGQVIPLYAHLWELTAPFVEQMLSDTEEGPEVSRSEINKAAQALLQTNYVIGANEIAHGHFLTTEQMTHNIVAVSIDWPTYLKWREVSKKKAPSLVTASG
jgi:hypothetical protein